MKMSLFLKQQHNHRAGVDAGFGALFAFGHPWPGTTQHGGSAEKKA
jgi:hypothetical protein